jgi:hypothetical protein
LTNLRDTADFDVDELVASTCSPTGSSPTLYCRVDRPASIRSRAIRPMTSVPVNSSYEGTGSSPDPSAARIRGREIGTRRSVLIRIDGAGSTHELLDWLSGSSGNGVQLRA